MEYSRNPKVIGAFLIGFAMVIGSYVFSNFGEPRTQLSGTLVAVADEAPSRVFIPVTDNNEDGLEDWRDQFLSAPAVNLTEVSTSDYLPPETLTGQLGVSLMEGLITIKGASSLGKTEEMVVAESIKKLEKIATADKIYDVRDIIITKDSSDEAIRTYGNTLANILITKSIPGLDNELLILKNQLESNDPKGKETLTALAGVYKDYRDSTLNTPVPERFVKTHLDLVNVYNAVYNDIETMTKASNDPMLPYVRLKRYEDDIQGMALAFTNAYNALVPYARVFKADDPAMVFANFNGGIQ